MALEIALAMVFLTLLGLCVAVLVWDIKRRRLGKEDDQETIAGLRERNAELEAELHRLKEEILFLERLNKKQGNE